MATVHAKGNNALKNSMARKKEWKEGMDQEIYVEGKSIKI